MQENIINTDLTQSRELYEKAIRFSTINTSKANIKKAVELFKEAAELGHIQSSYIVGEAYCKGKWSHDLSEEKCLSFLLNAAQKNHTEAMVVFGDLYHKNGQIFDALNEYMLALSHGSLTAFKRIEGLFDNPIGKNYINDLFAREASDKSNGDLQFYIATCYLHGLGTDKDLVRAHGWLIEAARNKNAFALHGLGQMYEHGVVVDVDLPTASEFYLQSGQNGFSKGFVALASIEAQKLNQQPQAKKDYSLVIANLMKAIELGDCYASNELGSMYAQGLPEGFPDYSEALKYFQHSADYGNPDGVLNLANLYYSISNIDLNNLMKAEAYFSSLLTLEDEFAKIAYYGIGRIKERSIDKKARKLGKKYILKSAEMGFDGAKVYLSTTKI